MTGDRVYLASSFKLADRVERVYQALQEAGHVVPDVWWRDKRLADQHPDAGTDEYFEHDEVHEMALRHFQNIAECDTFVLVAPKDRSRKFNGANIEYGFALAYTLHCYAVGQIERSAMYEPITRVDTVDELVEEL